MEREWDSRQKFSLHESHPGERENTPFLKKKPDVVGNLRFQ